MVMMYSNKATFFFPFLEMGKKEVIAVKLSSAHFTIRLPGIAHSGPKT